MAVTNDCQTAIAAIEEDEALLDYGINER